jgi:hypothetical protein
MLRDAGALARGSVVAVRVSKRLTTTVSQLCFATLRYSARATPLPARVLIKSPLASMATAGETERTFYAQLAPHLPSPPIARCLATAPESDPVAWLILEDLRSAYSNPAWPDPPNRSEALGAVTALAQVHARWWEAASLGATVGSLHTQESLRAMIAAIAVHLPAFLDAIVPRLPLKDRQLLERVFSSSLAPWLRLVDRTALTVTHGDAHTWNFLFPRSGRGLPYLVDWQVWHLDVGARDLAFMMALHWNRTLRRRLEHPLVQLYHRQLGAAGIANYPFDDLWLDYRRCVVRNLTFPLILWRRGLPREAWYQRLRNAIAAVRDLDAEELL